MRFIRLRTKLLVSFATVSILPVLLFAIIEENILGLTFIDPFKASLQNLSQLLGTSNSHITSVFLFLIMSWLLSLVVSFIFSKSMLHSIELIHNWSNYVGLGNLNFRLNIKSGDEIEQLSNSFNQMISSLQGAFTAIEKDKALIAGERDKLAVVLSGITDAVIAVDLKRKIVIYNNAAEQLLGISRQDAIGRDVQEILIISENGSFISADDYCPCDNIYINNIAFSKNDLQAISSKDTGGDISLQVKKFFVNVTAAQIQAGSVLNVGCILTLHDVTHEMELKKKEMDFVSMAVHELRTPLTIIKGYLGVFIKENTPVLTAEQNMFIDRVNSATQRLSSLVDNLINVSKIEGGGEIAVDLQPLNLIDVIQELLPIFTTKAKEKDIQLIVKPLPNILPIVIADKAGVTKVLVSLITNAILYTPTQGIVEVSFEKQNKQIITHIKDNGIGISPENMKHLFTKFYQIKEGLQQGSDGMGLGLFTSKAIIEANKGIITANSEIGVGSVFSFTLPATN